MRLSDLASRLGVPVEGDGSVEVRRASGLDEAGPGDLSFVRDAKYAAKVATTKASALILPPGIGAGSVPVLRSPAPDLHFLQAVMALHPRVRPPAGIHATAVIDPTARIGAGASVGPYVVVEADVSIGARAEIGPHVVIRRGVTIGDDAWVHARVVIREGCRIGHRVILQDGAVIGCDGFGFARRPDGTHQKIPQVGIVVIEDDVEIQANACVDRATLDVTYVRRGAKVDNLVQIAHNCDVGPDSILCGQVGLAGSTTLGRGVTLAGQAAVAGHLHIGDGATVLGQGGVIKDLEGGQIYAGTPTLPVRLHHKFHVSIPKLVDLPADVRRLEARVTALEQPERP